MALVRPMDGDVLRIHQHEEERICASAQRQSTQACVADPFGRTLDPRLSSGGCDMRLDMSRDLLLVVCLTVDPVLAIAQAVTESVVSDSVASQGELKCRRL